MVHHRSYASSSDTRRPGLVDAKCHPCFESFPASTGRLTSSSPLCVLLSLLLLHTPHTSSYAAGATPHVSGFLLTLALKELALQCGPLLQEPRLMAVQPAGVNPQGGLLGSVLSDLLVPSLFFVNASTRDPQPSCSPELRCFSSKTKFAKNKRQLRVLHALSRPRRGPRSDIARRSILKFA
eukprot:4715666-Amphidinium_carterae.1